MIHYLTRTDIASYETLPPDWNVRNVLLRVCTSKSPRFHALIDTGALITNMSNEEVLCFLSPVPESVRACLILKLLLTVL